MQINIDAERKDREGAMRIATAPKHAGPLGLVWRVFWSCRGCPPTGPKPPDRTQRDGEVGGCMGEGVQTSTFQTFIFKFQKCIF